MKLCKAGTFSRPEPVSNMPTVELFANEYLKMRKYLEAKYCLGTSKLTITGMPDLRSVILLQHVRNLAWVLHLKSSVNIKEINNINHNLTIKGILCAFSSKYCCGRF